MESGFYGLNNENMNRKELLITYTKRLWLANTANDITGLLLDYEKDLKLIEEREQVKNSSIPAVIESTTGYSCPNCGAICSEKTIVSKTKAIFEELPDPHYSWDETHKCQKCETLYLLHNRT